MAGASTSAGEILEYRYVDTYSDTFSIEGPWSFDTDPPAPRAIMRVSQVRESRSGGDRTQRRQCRRYNNGHTEYSSWTDDPTPISAPEVSKTGTSVATRGSQTTEYRQIRTWSDGAGHDVWHVVNEQSFTSAECAGADGS